MKNSLLGNKKACLKTFKAINGQLINYYELTSGITHCSEQAFVSF